MSCFILWHYCSNCRQILSYSSSSQIPGTCDSQACCYCSNFSLGVVFMFFFICVDQGFKKRSAIINATIGVVCLTTTGLIYCKIYSIVRHHTDQIQALQLQPVGQNQNGELANAARRKKTALATFYVYVVFVVCFLPVICVNAAYKIYGESELWLHLSYYSWTLMYLNSSLNPLVYCWKMRNIRQAVISVFRNIFQGQQSSIRTASPMRLLPSVPQKKKEIS